MIYIIFNEDYNTMKKEKIYLEYDLNSKSERILWSLISTAEGLQKWIADDVDDQGDIMEFTWGELHREHETRVANIQKRVKNKLIRLQWEDDADTDFYWQMEIEKSDLTGYYTMKVTDHALPEDLDTLRDIWDNNLEQLHRTSGV